MTRVHVHCTLAGWLLIGLLPFLASGSEYNAGIVEGLWYSKEPVFAGETVRMYVALRNNTGSDLTGRIIFFDNDDRLASQAVTALNGRIIEAWTDWKPSEGAHELRVELAHVTLDTVDGPDRSVEVPNSTISDSVYVDLDTDEDGIGNHDDEDDDNDGISDEEETENGTDPLVPNILSTTDDESTGESASTTEETDTNSDDTASRSSRQGLEQYFNEGSLQNSLAALTNLFQNTKTNLDAYRANRQVTSSTDEATQTPTPAKQATTTQQSGLDTTLNAISRAKLQPDETTWSERVFGFISRNLNALYSALLFGVSSALARPLLLQLLLLFLLLFIIYKLARRLGKRSG